MTNPESLDLRANHVVGRNVERIAALSDGLYAIVMTLLIIELSGPAVESVHSEGDLWHGLVALAPRLLMYVISFLTLGLYWVGQQSVLHLVEHSDRHFTWINLAVLAAIALFPFSTALMAEFLYYRVALGLYWFNIALAGVGLIASIAYAERAGLVKNDPLHHRAASVLRRSITVAQLIYAFGALLCIFSTYLSIAFILVMQLYYAIAPGWRRWMPKSASS